MSRGTCTTVKREGGVISVELRTGTLGIGGLARCIQVAGVAVAPVIAPIAAGGLYAQLKAGIPAAAPRDLPRTRLVTTLVTVV